MIIRTRQGSEPSGGAEQGRLITQIGNIFIEYTGAKPTAQELADHLNPAQPIAPLDAEELFDILKTKGIVSDPDRPRPKA